MLTDQRSPTLLRPAYTSSDLCTDTNDDKIAISVDMIMKLINNRPLVLPVFIASIKH